MEDIDQLIEDYELASARLTQIIVDVDQQNDALHIANEELERTFNALLDARPESQSSVMSHVECLLQIIKSMHPDDALLARLADRIHMNVLRLGTLSDQAFE